MKISRVLLTVMLLSGFVTCSCLQSEDLSWQQIRLASDRVAA